MPLEEIAKINFMIDVYTVILLLGLIVVIYFVVRNKNMKKDIKFVTSIGLIFIAFILYYTPRYYAVINLQKKYFGDMNLQSKFFDFDKEFDQGK